MPLGRQSTYPWLTLAIALLAYVGSYAWYSATHLQVRASDGQPCVIFESSLSYYLFRPIAYVDGAISGMRFHVGPHR